MKGKIMLNISENARLVWNTIKNAGRMTFIDIITNSRLCATDVAYAIGWLVRDNKIIMVEENDGNRYFLPIYS